MKAYKAFNPDGTCRGFQYEEGKSYKHDGKVKLCQAGFHACENPIDCFGYYEPAHSVIREVELDGVSDERENDTKVVATDIKIGVKLDIAGICKAHFEYVKSHTIKENGRAAGDCESASAGNWGSASAGEQGSASAGNWGSASAGEQGIAACRGGKVRGGIGCALCITELDDGGKNIHAKAVIVDGEKIKADTWYTLKNGRIVIVKE